MTLRVENEDPVLVATVLDPIIDAHNGTVFREELRALLKERSYIVLDLRHLGFIDSSGIGAILSCMRLARSLGGEIMLAEPTANVQAILNILQMSRVIHIFSTRQEALIALQQLAQTLTAPPRPQQT